jgi:hypothetical protein
MVYPPPPRARSAIDITNPILTPLLVMRNIPFWPVFAFLPVLPSLKKTYFVTSNLYAYARQATINLLARLTLISTMNKVRLFLKFDSSYAHLTVDHGLNSERVEKDKDEWKGLS